MYYKLYQIFLYPEVYMLAALVVIYRFWPRWKARTRRMVVGVYAIVVYAFTTPFLIYVLVAGIERQYYPITDCDSTISHNILVLGAGFDSDPDVPELTRLSRSGLARITEGVRLANCMPGSTVITSGYFPNTGEDIAATMRAAAISLGIVPDRIRMQLPAHNTRAEAAAYTEVFSPNDTLILVTGAIHMPRAVKLFANAGVSHIIPAPCDYRVFPGEATRWFHFIPAGENLELWRKWGKEVVGGMLEM
jgi:uncharacterized SAM-binding protein YcdF (DUF218 family)